MKLTKCLLVAKVFCLSLDNCNYVVMLFSGRLVRSAGGSASSGSASDDHGASAVGSATGKGR